MEVGVEVTSTSENDAKISLCDEPPVVDPSKKPADAAVSKSDDAGEDSIAFTQGIKLNGDVSGDGPPILDGSPDELHEPISSSGAICSNNVVDSSVTSTEADDVPPITETNDEPLKSCSESDEIVAMADVPAAPSTRKISEYTDITDVNDEVLRLPTSSNATNLDDVIMEEQSSPTSSELHDKVVKAKGSTENPTLVVSCPTVSATSTCSPVEIHPVVTCTKVDKSELSIESFQLTNRSEVAKKEAITLVEKLALNTSITVSRKEMKPEAAKAEFIPEGRVLRLRPTPKPDPPKPAHKPSPKSTEGRKTSTSSSSGGDKSSNKASKGQKRKHDDGEVDEKCNSVPIQYKGYKKLVSISEPVKKSTIKFNPFNPAFRRECTRVPSQVICSSFDSPQQDQQEYAQYLGLQPLVKFRCSNCGMSSFQTMNALNAHKAECNKTIGTMNQGQQVKVPCSTGQLDTSQSEPKSANIKLTRKVFLCSACGTYYELWNLFLHMREAHRRYICLECLGMSSSPEKLSEHLKQKHGVISQSFEDPDKFSPSILPQAYYLMCIHCDKIYSEEDKFISHKCPKKSEVDSSAVCVKNPVVSSQTQTSEPPKHSVENIQSVSSGSVKQPLRRTREATRKSMKLAQQKKEAEVVKSAVQKESIEAVIQEPEAPPVEVPETIKPDPEPLETEVLTPPVVQEPTLPEVSDEVKTEELIDNQVPPDPTPSVESSEETDRCSDLKDDLEATVDNDESRIHEKENNVEFPNPLPNLVKPEPIETSSDLIAEPAAPPEDSLASTIPSLPLVPPLSLSKNKNAKKVRKPARRKRPLTWRPRSRKPKQVHVPVHVVNPSGLLPNPLNSIHYLPQENTESPNMDREVNSEHVPPIPVEAPKEPSQEFMNKLPLQFKLKLNPDMDIEGDSDDSQKLSLVVDESANNSDAETKSIGQKDGYEERPAIPVDQAVSPSNIIALPGNGLTLAGDDIQPMALALEDKIENVPIQAVLKECVRTSCLSCNYCRHAHKIAVNGKYLALHLLSEHRYLPIKNETPDDVITKLKNSLDELESMCFNTETYDNTDVTIHVPYDQDTTFDCFQCNYACGTHKDLFAHKRKFHSKPLLLCIMCKTNFFSYSEMLCHLCPGHYTEEIMFHNLHINYRCCFCRLDNIPSAFRLMVHLRKTHHTCDICLESCTDQQKLSTHLWKHKVNHLCYRCGISYASKPDITKHLFWKHGHESVLCKKCLQKKWPHVYHFCIPPTSFICEECSASFSKAVALKVHKRLHAEEFPYACNECGKKFISKKLLDRHEERHRNIELGTNGNNDESVNPEDDQKDEIINVTDVVDAKDDVEGESGDVKDEVKEKAHKKHRKDKKDKVVDPYDLPPLNLSSESDSSDEEEPSKKPEAEDGKSEHSNEGIVNEANSNSATGDTLEVPEPHVDEESLSAIPKSENDEIANAASVDSSDTTIKPKVDDLEAPKPVDNADKSTVDVPNDETDYQVDGIWENFYKTNPTNHNLPYPLCAMKSEDAYGIIMGDHDYCMQVKVDPVIKDDLPSNSNLETGFNEDNMEEPQVNNDDKPADPVTPSDEKKKGKSPKKRLKNPNDNSSSSSESSSDSDSSSCTCGTNCSCSSSSSNSSSSSSSDSDSSAGEGKTKEERRKKKKERKSKSKPETPQEVPKEEEVEKPPEVDNTPRVPVDPPIQESELDTNESSTDEEFYDKQPGKIANQIIAEKRNQLILSVAPPKSGSGTNSPQLDSTPAPLKLTPVPKSRTKEKKRRRVLSKTKAIPADQQSLLSHSLQTPPVDQQFVTDYSDNSTASQYPAYSTASPSVIPYQTPVPSMSSTPNNSTVSSAGMSENDKSRSSKRRRIPNKFYGYSSGEEDEKPPLQKWRKPQELTPSVPRLQAPPQPSPTPRIQLTVPKQVIRKPSYHKIQKTPKITIAPPVPPAPLPPPPPPPQTVLPPPFQRPVPESSETDSDSDATHPPTSYVPPPRPPQPPTQTSSTSSKPEKDVYCYCRCPYDEVSEMIACDDESCPIEWFHFECVGILVPPRGQWYCPGCRKARGLPT